MRRKTFVCLIEHMRKHARRRGFSVTAADAYFLFEVFRYDFQKFASAENIKLVRLSFRKFGIGFGNRVAVNHDVLTRNVLAAMPDIYRYPLFPELIEIFASRDIAAANAKTYTVKITGKRTHAHAPYAYKMYVQRFVLYIHNKNICR